MIFQDKLLCMFASLKFCPELTFRWANFFFSDYPQWYILSPIKDEIKSQKLSKYMLTIDYILLGCHSGFLQNLYDMHKLQTEVICSWSWITFVFRLGFHKIHGTYRRMGMIYGHFTLSHKDRTLMERTLPKKEISLKHCLPSSCMPIPPSTTTIFLLLTFWQSQVS